MSSIRVLFLTCGLLAAMQAQTTTPLTNSQPTPPNPKRVVAGTPYRYQPNPMPRRAELYYDLVWGVDSLSVKSAESGEIIRFAYRILDADKAKTLNDKKLEPALLDPQAGVRLSVPALEKVGQLRQSSTPIVGKSYWMAFSNKGRLVKRGDHVIVQIGTFKADGLVVQ